MNNVVFGPGTLQYELQHPTDPLLKRAVADPESITLADMKEMVRRATEFDCPSQGRQHVPSGPWRWEDEFMFDTCQQSGPKVFDLDRDAETVDYILSQWFMYARFQGRWCENKQCSDVVRARTLTDPRSIALGEQRYNHLVDAVFPPGWRTHPTVQRLITEYELQLVAAGGDLLQTERWEDWLGEGMKAPPAKRGPRS